MKSIFSVFLLAVVSNLLIWGSVVYGVFWCADHFGLIAAIGGK